MTAPAGTLLSQLLANLPPVLGVAFLGWQVRDVVMLYWVENVVLGLLNVVAMLMAGREENGRSPADPVSKGVNTVFFAGHYGAFCAGHGVVLAILFTLFAAKAAGNLDDADPDLLAMLADMARQPSILLATATMAIGHAAAFWTSYVANGAYREASHDRLMMRPYRRIIATHLFVFAAVFALQGLGNPLVAVLAFIALKVAVERLAMPGDAGPKPGG